MKHAVPTEALDFRTASRRYEAWLAHYVTVDRTALAKKHTLLRESPRAMLRGSFFRWPGILATLPPAVRDAPRLLSAGDLHLENFGTWRDAEGRLVWGINDFDEAAPLPCTSDLVRLATSALLEAEEGHLRQRPRQAVAAVAAGYLQGLRAPPRAFVLENTNPGLRALADRAAPDVVAAWARYRRDGKVPPRLLTPEIRQLLTASLPRGAGPPRFFRRLAGLGSLGRPRIVALADWQDGEVAREAKAAVPSAIYWHRDNIADPLRHYRQILRFASQGADPTLRLTRGWAIKRLSPETRKIELAVLVQSDDPQHLLRCMGHEVATLHCRVAGGGKPLRRYLAGLPDGWLDAAARQAADLVRGDLESMRRG